MKYLFFTIVAVVSLLCAAPISYAQNLDAVALTIDGEIAGDGPRNFSISELEALGSVTIETETPWHDGKVKFEGVPLDRLMEHIGASGKTAFVIALNNYRTEVPISDFSKYPVILAIKKDGIYMPVSDKGPLFIIYPYDSYDELNSELYYSRSAWQVRSITIN
ncbi:MAG: oxidoreductase [Hyphomicrobiales bacterium]|nr:oxidoreductase [Hyphomicrobiales bacterium]